MKIQAACLIVEIGEPYEKGAGIPLNIQKDILLGRLWEEYMPDVSFTSLYVSRRHALITSKDDGFYITDLKSKHGTMINNNPINPNQPAVLKHGDLITLANDNVILYFSNPVETGPDETVELTSAIPVVPKGTPERITINPDRREVSIDGQPLALVGKDVDLLLLLYERRNKAVSYDEIKARVWPERIPDPIRNIPDVGNDEITSLVYRLRKRLGSYGDLISAVPRYGYMLDI